MPMQGRRPANPDDMPRTYVDGQRADDLPYRPPPRSPGKQFNEVTAEAALPVLASLLPGGSPLRWSLPSPHGLPGGYPVRISDSRVRLDLPAGVTVEEAVALNKRWTRGDGIDHIDNDGTVHYTEDAQRAVARLHPVLAQPLTLAGLEERVDRLDHCLGKHHRAADTVLPVR